jgi:hypothetical protein
MSAGTQGASQALALAAAPTFAAMAVVTAMLGSSSTEMMCASGHITALGGLGGMGTMYLLMSAFHVGPWLRLISSRRDRA